MIATEKKGNIWDKPSKKLRKEKNSKVRKGEGILNL